MTERDTAGTKKSFNPLGAFVQGVGDFVGEVREQAAGFVDIGADATRELGHDVKVAAKTVAHNPKAAVRGVIGAASEVKHMAGDVVDTLKDGADTMHKIVIGREDVHDHMMHTPQDRWFSPERGWPTSVSNEPKDLHGNIMHPWKPPKKMMPTADDEGAACLFEGVDDEAIGELRVEIIEARNLPVKDFVTRSTDAFAVVVFEGNVARTDVVRNTCNPKWSANWPRAMRFPIINPYSNLHIALFDHDDESEMIGNVLAKVTTLGLVESQMAIGRVVVPLANVAGGTVYDTWLPLHLSSDMLILGKIGHLRLRYSLSFKSERRRMLMYPLDSPRTFVLPLVDRGAFSKANFTVRGYNSDAAYSWDKLTNHFDEVSEHLEWFLGAGEILAGILFWRSPHTLLSLVLCIAFQMLISYPAWTFSTLPLIGVIVLHYTYGSSPPAPPISQKPTPLQLVKGLVLNQQPPPLTIRPNPAAAKAALEASHGCPIFDEALGAFDTFKEKETEDIDEVDFDLAAAFGNALKPENLVNAVTDTVQATTAVVSDTIQTTTAVVGDTLHATVEATEGAVFNTVDYATSTVSSGAAKVAETASGVVEDPLSVAFTLFVSREAAAQKKHRQITQLREAFKEVERQVEEAIEDALDNDHDDDEELAQRLLAKAGHEHLIEEEEEAEEKPKKGLAAVSSAVTNKLEYAGDRAKSLLGVTHSDESSAQGIAHKAGEIFNTVNPLVAYLHPLQIQLGEVLEKVRMVRRVLTWRDPRLTLWLYMALWASAVLLFAFVKYMPWYLIGPWLFRLLFFGLTGPHMYLVGRYFKKKADEEELVAAAYDEGNKATRARILGERREQLMRLAVTRVKKALEAQAKRSLVERQRAEYYAASQLKLMVTPPPVSGEKKFIMPEQGHSKAVPLAGYLRAKRKTEAAASKGAGNASKAAELV